VVDRLERLGFEDVELSLGHLGQKPLKVLGWDFVLGLIFAEKGLQLELELDLEVNVDVELEVEG
jgi:hypothetical protein